MIYPIFGRALYLISIIEVFGVSQVISSSFQRYSFSNDKNWVVSGAQPQFTDWMGPKLFGGFSAFSRRVSASQTFELPPICNCNFGKQINGTLDNQIAWQKKQNYYDGTSMCGGNWNEVSVNLNLNIKHSGPTAVVIFTTNLDQGPDNLQQLENLIRSLVDLEISLYQSRNVLKNVQYTNRLILYLNTSWNQLDINGIVLDGWIVRSGISEATKCRLCYPTCYQCDGPNIDNCTDCGDPNIYHNHLVAGQRICLIRTIEYIQIDETLCLPCHPRCEKCYLPFDIVGSLYFDVSLKI